MTAHLTHVAPGVVVAEERRSLTRSDLRAYAAASGDDNPIHRDENFAKSVGLPDVIAHGMLTMGLVASVVEELAVGVGVIREFGARFAAPVVVPEQGETEVQIRVSVLSRDDRAGTVTLDAAVSVAGTKVLSRTRAVIKLD